VSFDGKTVLITGAARGVGRACAERFARDGADLVLLDIAHDLDTVPYSLGSRQQLATTAEHCRAIGAAVLETVADVRLQAEVTAAVDAALGRFGRVDVLVNSAGVSAPAGKPAHEISEAEWDVMLDIDLSGAWRMMKAVAPAMVGQRDGSIINVASSAGTVGYRHFAAYVAAKHGLVGLTKASALDYGPVNVRVNALCPGSIRDDDDLGGVMLSEIARSLGVSVTDYEAVFRQQQPNNRLVEATDVAAAAAWLAGNDACHVTGSVVSVDGGFTAQ